jgi:hypothetical protein
LEPGYHFLGMRDFTKRLRHVFAEHGKGGLPNLWLHTTAQQAVHAWLGDVSWEGENVSPGGLENDYLDAHPASRLRSIGMGRNLGTIPLIFCQAASHYVGPEEVRSFLVHQFVGWVLAHDCLPSRDQQIYSAILGPELELWSPETRFLPYWKKGEGISTEASDVFVSAHSRPGQAVLWVVNASREKTQAPVEVDLKALQLTGHGNLFVFDVETGVRIKHTVKGDDLKFSLEIPARLWRGVRIVRSEQLTDSTAFVAAFDRGEVSADEAFGCRFPANGHGDLVAGKSGQGLSLEKPVSFQTRLHLNSTSGGVRMDLECDPATANGSLFRVGNLSVRINRGQIFLFNGETVLAQGSVEGAGRRWIAIAIEWSDGVTRVAVDGKTIVEHATVPVIPALGHGLNVEARSPDKPKQNLTPTRMQIGPVPGVVLDNLILSQKSKS